MNKPLWIGLFTNLDSIINASLDLILRLKGLGIKKQGKEYFVSEDKFRVIDKLLPGRERTIGGNAGNASYFLGKLGIENNLSAPSRSPEIMAFFEDLPVNFYGIRKKTARQAVRGADSSPEHIIMEIRPPFGNFSRTIITWDEIARNGVLDEGFWQAMKKGVLLLSGFHLIKKKSRVKEIIDKLKDKKLEIYLEMGEPNAVMKFATKELLKAGLLSHIGLNEREIKRVFGKSPLKARELSRQLDVGLTVHSPDFVISSDSRGLRSAVDIIQSWAMGDFSYYKEISMLPLKRTIKEVEPTRALPYLERITGLGDAFAAINTVRLFYPSVFDKLVHSLPFYGTKQFPTHF